MIPETAELPAAEELQVKLIPLSWIKEDHDTQVRGGVFSHRVKELSNFLLETGLHLDPVDVFQEPDSGDINAGNAVWLGDGFHRMAAYRENGRTKIPARIRTGSKSEALEFGLRKNGHHGTPMSSKEKRHAAEIAVADPRIGEFTDKKIAMLIGISTSLVNQVRRGVKPGAKSGAEPESPVVVPSAPPAPSGGSHESESPAPRSATARERHPDDARPTRAGIVHQIAEWLKHDMIDDDDILKLIASPDGQYAYLPKDGQGIILRVVGVSGREQIEVPAAIKEVGFEKITLRYSAGKLKAE